MGHQKCHRSAIMSVIPVEWVWVCVCVCCTGGVALDVCVAWGGILHGRGLRCAQAHKYSRNFPPTTWIHFTSCLYMCTGGAHCMVVPGKDASCPFGMPSGAHHLLVPSDAQLCPLSKAWRCLVPGRDSGAFCCPPVPAAI